MSLIKLEDCDFKAPVSEIAPLQLTTVSPVHIGGRAEISANRFLLTETDSVVVDEEKLFEKFFQRQGLIDQYLTQVRQGRGWLDSFQFIKQMRPAERDRFAKDVAAYQLKTHQGTPLSEVRGIRPFVRDGRHRAYIPGTSIKGAIRTAVLYGQLVELKKSNPGDFNRIINDIRQRVGRCHPSRNRPALDSDPDINLIEKILQDQSLRAPNNSLIQQGERSLFDLLKTLAIGDAEPATVKLNLCRIQLVSEGGSRGWHFSERNGRPIPIHAEVLPEGLTFDCDGTVDLFTIGRFQGRESPPKACYSNFKSVLSLMQRNADDLLAFERGYFSYIYNLRHDLPIKNALDEYDRIKAEKPNLRIGWGSGLTGITIIRLLDSDVQVAIRDQVFGNQRHSRMKYFPKTRRFIVSSSSQRGSNEGQWALIAPLGWCRLEVVEEEE